MPRVEEYIVQVNGSEAGYQNTRAQIQLAASNKSRPPLAYLRFHDPGMDFGEDGPAANGVPVMNLPTSMFEAVLDILRNEDPIYVNLSGMGMVILSTGREPSGEDD